jgi:hypothetical protein
MQRAIFGPAAAAFAESPGGRTRVDRRGWWRNGAERKVMSTIAEWLTSLGMSEYAQRFAENAIDVSVIRHLTDQDLKDIGVLLGHRRKMLAAIAALAGTARPRLKSARRSRPAEPSPSES